MIKQIRKRLYNENEAAEYLGRSLWGIRELRYKGALRYVKEGKRIQYDIQDLDQFIETHKMQFTY